MTDNVEPDPWGFTAKPKADTASGDNVEPDPRGFIAPPKVVAASSDGAEEDPWAFMAPRKAESASGDRAAPVPARPIEKREAGEFRAQMVTVSLKRRAWPMAVALVAIFFAGFITEVVAASEMISLAGTGVLLIMYPLGGLGLIMLGLLQFRLVDGAARLRVIRYASLTYALLFGVALSCLIGGVVPIIATGVIWILADQLNYLMPLLIWSLAGDEFNVAEGRKIFGWLVAWTYLGQLSGLAVALVTPVLFSNFNIKLTNLLLIVPVVCVVIGLWLPRAMRGRSSAGEATRREGYGDSLKSAAEFINGVPVWRSLVAASTLTFIAGSTVILGYSVGVGEIVGRDAATLQMIFAATWLGALSTCWAIQHFLAERIAEKWDVQGTLFILPVATIAAAVVLTLGLGISSLALLVAAIVMWRLPRWSLDENARRGALSLVPDERRTRVSFIVNLMPVAVGLVMSAPVMIIGITLNRLWISGIVAAIIGVAGAFFSWKVVKGWEDSLTNWRLRRKKQNRTMGLDINTTHGRIQ